MRRPSLPRPRWVVTLGAALVLVVVALAVVAGAGDDAADRTRTEELLLPVGPEPDGSPVELDVAVTTPPADVPGADGDGRRAAVLLAHGFGGSRDDLAGAAREVAAAGYVVLTWTARGFGRSGGRIHLDAPGFEVADARRLLDLLAARDDVRLDGPGDPVAGVAGASYGGALALMTAGLDDRVDALVPAITWHDLSDAFFPQAAAGVAAAGVFKQRWASLFVTGSLGAAEAAAGGAGDRGAGDGGATDVAGERLCGRFAADVCALFRRTATTGRPAPGAGARLRRSSPAPLLDAVAAPTLLVQGEQDSLFGLGEADRTARALAARGTEVAVHWVDGGHDAAGATLADDELVGPALAWFDHHLRGGPDPGTAFELALPAPRLGDGGPEQLEADAYGADGRLRLALEGGPQPVLSPAGGEPSALTALPGAGAVLGRAAAATGAAFGLAALPGQSAVLTSPPVQEPVTVAGSPRVRLSVTSTASDATLFASAWVVSADGVATLPRQLVAPLRVPTRPGEPREVAVDLPWSAYRLEAGERLRVVVASTDAAYAVPDDQRLYTVAPPDGGAEVVLPTVDAREVSTGPLVPPWLAAVALALVLLAAALALLARRRGRAGAGQRPPDEAAPPLRVEGLVKSYADGFRAVDGVTWEAGRGQVVGLLGPNGAGKTTTMRMLVGLVRPDAGEVRVLGRRVRPGAPVLGRVGALIEGPGFLPHLSGRDNLRAAWAATGRPAADADVEDALAVADLGSAADRPVRTYSHGMRQRLGIAQALLGRPDLLLLDEPTNGLDPSQIAGLRGVLQRYAAGGRCVVVSSHLLAEVEQTCSHVVVLHRGRVVLSGAVPALLGESAATLLAVEGARHPDEPVAVLRGVAGVEDVEVLEDAGAGPGDGTVRLRVDGTAARPDLVAALVREGLGVAAVDGRRRLEEVFMGLVGDDRAARPDADAAVVR